MNLLTKIAAILMFIAALFHLAIQLLSGFFPSSLLQLALTVLYFVLGWLVLKNRRWAIWLSFLIVLFGGIAGMSGYLGASANPGWASLGICVASWTAAVCLFSVLWKDHVPGVITAAQPAAAHEQTPGGA